MVSLRSEDGKATGCCLEAAIGELPNQYGGQTMIPVEWCRGILLFFPLEMFSPHKNQPCAVSLFRVNYDCSWTASLMSIRDNHETL